MFYFEYIILYLTEGCIQLRYKIQYGTYEHNLIVAMCKKQNIGITRVRETQFAMLKKKAVNHEKVLCVFFFGEVKKK